MMQNRSVSTSWGVLDAAMPDVTRPWRTTEETSEAMTLRGPKTIGVRDPARTATIGVTIALASPARIPYPVYWGPSGWTASAPRPMLTGMERSAAVAPPARSPLVVDGCALARPGATSTREDSRGLSTALTSRHLAAEL